MRKEKRITINGHEIVIQELTQRQIRDIFMGLMNPNAEDANQSWPTFLLNQLPKLAGISFDAWLDMTPSDTKEIWLAIQEVNANFLAIPGLLETWGFGNAIHQLKQAIISQTVSNVITNPIPESVAQPLSLAKDSQMSNESDIANVRNYPKPVPMN